MADVMTKVAFSADVTSLATAVGGLHEGFESPSAVDVHRDARGKCAQRGVHCCRGCGSGGVCVEEREWSAQGSSVSWQGYGMSRGVSRGKMEGLICEAVEV
jgi:hypothetical protein